MEFDDFEQNDNRSKKRKMEKQADYLPASRRYKISDNSMFFNCLSVSVSIQNKSLIMANEKIIDDYLFLLSQNFTYKNNVVQSIKCLDNSNPNYEYSNIVFVPKRSESGWNLTTITNGISESEKFEIIEHEQIYAMLMKATSKLTSQVYDRNNWNKFRNFLNSVLNFEEFYNHCYACFCSLTSIYQCKECPLVFCKKCKCLRHEK